MRPSEYATLDALALARLVAAREVKPSELLAAAIDRADALNPGLNAIVHRFDDMARERAALLDATPEGPLAGVPMVLKDLLGDHAGVPTTHGSRFLRDFVAPFDSELVARYKRAGMLPFAKTNTPEFGLVCTTEPALWGPCRNPWDRHRTTGGSSGGSAAAVAAGIVPVGHANDGGGSIRIPASCCGLVGMKPTRGRITLAPLIGDLMNGLVQEHAVTRTVRDSAAVLDATAGPAPGDPYWAAPPEGSFLDATERAPARLRIAFSTRSPFGSSVDPECVTAVERTANLLTELGHQVEEADLPLDPGLKDTFLTIWAVGPAATVDGLGLLTGRTATADDLEPMTWSMVQRGREIAASAYMLAIAQIQLASRQVAAFHEQYDILVTPTVAAPPIPLGTIDTGNPDLESAFAPVVEFAPFTAIQNMTGQPAVSLPLQQSSQGLPIGIQFAARYGEETTLFSLAAQLEAAYPWHERRPPASHG